MAAVVTGYRRLPSSGNVQQVSRTLISLSPGTYHWSVQAIDTAYAGSPFAGEGTFSTEPSTLSINDVTVTEGNAGTTHRDVHGEPLGGQRADRSPSTTRRPTARPPRAGLRGGLRDADLRSGLDHADLHRHRERRHRGRAERDVLRQPQRRHERDHRRRPGHRHDHQRRRPRRRCRSTT